MASAGQLLLLGFALSLSSTVLVVKVLEENGAMASLAGQIAIGVLVIQDLAAVAFLAAAADGWPSLWAPLLLLLIPVRRLLTLVQRVGHGELSGALLAPARPGRRGGVRAASTRMARGSPSSAWAALPLPPGFQTRSSTYGRPARRSSSISRPWRVGVCPSMWRTSWIDRRPLKVVEAQLGMCAHGLGQRSVLHGSPRRGIIRLHFVASFEVCPACHAEPGTNQRVGAAELVARVGTRRDPTPCVHPSP
ncbi:MAG: cation:proton antiporter [Gemmatimonadetes bacterium]|nr:cation:proton antiporter [Gemmatimonadota bacterium]